MLGEFPRLIRPARLRAIQCIAFPGVRASVNEKRVVLRLDEHRRQFVRRLRMHIRPRVSHAELHVRDSAGERDPLLEDDLRQIRARRPVLRHRLRVERCLLRLQLQHPRRLVLPSPALHRIPDPRLLVPHRAVLRSVVRLLHQPPAVPMIDHVLPRGTHREKCDAGTRGFLHTKTQLAVVDEDEVVGGTLDGSGSGGQNTKHQDPKPKEAPNHKLQRTLRPQRDPGVWSLDLGV